MWCVLFYAIGGRFQSRQVGIFFPIFKPAMVVLRLGSACVILVICRSGSNNDPLYLSYISCKQVASRLTQYND